MANQKKYSTVADKLGITSAVICAVHCLIIPALFLLKYSVVDSVTAESGSAGWGSGLPDWWEKLDYIFLIIGFVAVYHAATHVSIKIIKVSLWFFWLVLAIAVVFENELHWLAYVASIGLIATHFVNIRRHHSGKKSTIVGVTNNKIAQSDPAPADFEIFH